MRDQAGQERPGLVDDPNVVGAGTQARHPGLQDALDGPDHLPRQPGDVLPRRLERPQACGALGGLKEKLWLR